MSGFGSAVAGYRYFAPFKLYEIKVDANPLAQQAYTVARGIAQSPASWDIHPLARSPGVLTSHGNLNKNLMNLILECFTAEQIQQMATDRIIYAVPTVQPGHTNWKNWQSAPRIGNVNPIFPVNTVSHFPPPHPPNL